MSFQNEEKLASLKSELARQEHVYEDAYQKHVEMQERFDRDAKELYMVSDVVHAHACCDMYMHVTGRAG